MHGEHIFTLASSSAHCDDCSNYYLLHKAYPLIHLMDVMVNVAMANPLSNMGGYDRIQPLLPADVGTMKIDIFPWNEWSGLKGTIATLRLESSLPTDDHVVDGSVGVSP